MLFICYQTSSAQPATISLPVGIGSQCGEVGEIKNSLKFFDVTYAGFKDNNNDFINDDFQADGDSDNDGIINMLDLRYVGTVLPVQILNFTGTLQ